MNSMDEMNWFLSHLIAATLGGIAVVVLIAIYYGAGPEE